MLHATGVEALGQVIAAIGSEGFFSVSTSVVGRLAGFGLATVVVHRRGQRPHLCFDNFDQVGGRVGIQNYLAWTHRFNPMLGSCRTGQIVRASDFHASQRPRGAISMLRSAPHEELGFLTDGWPPNLEEIGFYFEDNGAIVEWSLYRESGTKPISRQVIRALNTMAPLLRGAVLRHRAITQSRELSPGPAWKALSAREQEIAALMLEGHSTESIALRLGISMHTVKDHRKSIFRKLKVGSLAAFFAHLDRCGAAWQPDRGPS
jgi:DNA-binding CsgD family transcriptional regulator